MFIKRYNNSLAYLASLLVIQLVIALLFHADKVYANPVRGQYLNTSGGTVLLQLHIASPAPQNLILEQYIPPGTTVLSTSPRARKVNSQSGVVKWLFKQISTGTINVSMKVSPNESSRAVNGTLRYRAKGGQMVETRITP